MLITCASSVKHIWGWYAGLVCGDWNAEGWYARGWYARSWYVVVAMLHKKIRVTKPLYIIMQGLLHKTLHMTHTPPFLLLVV